MLKLPLAILVVLTLAGSLPAQRNDLAQRLMKLEAAWEESSSVGRARALSSVEEAVQSFFRFRLARAGRLLDEARFLLAGEEIDPAHAWAASRRFQLSQRILDPVAGDWLTIVGDRFYESGAEPEKRGLSYLFLNRADGQQVLPVEAKRETVNGEFHQKFRFDGKAQSSDLRLVIRLYDSAETLDRFEYALALIPNFEKRIAALEAEATREDRPEDWRRATLTHGIKALRALRGQKVPENEPLALHRLRSLEEIAGLKEAATIPAGEHLLRLPRERGADTLRIAIPEDASRKSPLLVLVHGAGGSENLFFEGHGRGAYVAEGLQRGAIVIAPRASLFGGLDLVGLLDRLAAVQPFNRARVFLVGHSMGAGVVLNAADRAESRFGAVVAIAGGRKVRRPERVTRSALFLGTAKRDFSRQAMLGLAEQLREIEGASLTLRDIENSEHLMVVQDLLGEVFSFLDERGLVRPREGR